MKVISRFQAMAFLALGLAAICPQADAQFFGLGVNSSPNPIAVNGTLTYTINLTNQSGNNILNVVVTNALPASVQVVGFPTTTLGSASTNASGVIFSLGQFNIAAIAQMSVTARPTVAGFVTNVVTVFASSFPGVLTTTNIVTQVTNIPPTVTDLAVSVTGPATPVVLNDWITYGVTVSNLGPASAASVVLSNTFLPAGVEFISLSPANPSTNSTTVYNLGTLANLAVRNFTLTVQPTNAGALPFFASVNSTNIIDSNSANDTATNTVTVETVLTNQLIATNLTGMTFNPQNALMEQTVRLVNIGTSNVASARVIVTGLTNWLYNAVGTNTLGTTNRNPFVVYSGSLAPGESADLLLQYFVPNRQAINVDNTNYIAVETSAVNLSVPAFSTLTISNLVVLTNGSVLIEFTATPGKSYQIQYTTDPAFVTGVLLAQPTIVAQADKVQWIDNGPPNTVSFPMSVPMRFYRVQELNP